MLIVAFGLRLFRNESSKADLTDGMFILTLPSGKNLKCVWMNILSVTLKDFFFNTSVMSWKQRETCL